MVATVDCGYNNVVVLHHTVEFQVTQLRTAQGWDRTVTGEICEIARSTLGGVRSCARLCETLKLQRCIWVWGNDPNDK